MDPKTGKMNWTSRVDAILINNKLDIFVENLYESHEDFYFASAFPTSIIGLTHTIEGGSYSFS